MTNKEKYIQFCAERPDIPVFSQPWWLDAICPNSWDVILIERNGKIVASFPYQKKKILKIFTQIGQPLLTQKLGPYIVYESDSLKESKKIQYEHEIYNAIIDNLPKFDAFLINFNWKYKNWLPFYWNGFEQTARYTYILDDIKNYDNLAINYARRKKRLIQKAEKTLTIRYDLPKDVFYDYFVNVIRERGGIVEFSKPIFERIYNAVYEQNVGKVFYCIDAEENIHAISLVIWDCECAYYLVAMRDEKYKNSGGTEFLVNEMIKYVSKFVNKFDFEGSMIKGVEESFRQYGARQTEYYTIFKHNNPFLKMIRDIRNSITKK